MNSTKSTGGPAAAHVRDDTDEKLIVDSHLTMSGMYDRAINGANILPKERGGISLCKHGGPRNLCKEYDSASICEHGRHRNHCKECGGASICEHGRQRSRCKECGSRVDRKVPKVSVGT